MKKQTTIGLILAALFTALGVLFPIVFHAFGMGGAVFLPMHIPVLLCGLICGWRYGGLVGLIVPFLSSILTGMPPIYPVAVYMAIELVTYGIVSGILIKQYNTLIALVGAMLTGRIMLGIGQFIILGLSGKTFGLAGFLTNAFVTGIPGMLIQIILIPVIMITLKKALILDKVAQSL